MYSVDSSDVNVGGVCGGSEEAAVGSRDSESKDSILIVRTNR